VRKCSEISLESLVPVRGGDLPDRQTAERRAGTRLCDRPPECTFILVGIVSVLGIITLRQEVAGASEGSVAYTLAAIKDWTFLRARLGRRLGKRADPGLPDVPLQLVPLQLVPRRAAWFGLVGGPLIILSGTLVLIRR
jgi:hypothetical protein